jgi:hypothetical protein
MRPKRILMAGAVSLNGSVTCRDLGRRVHEVCGLDNDTRAALLGPQADAIRNRRSLEDAGRDIVNGWRHRLAR